MSKSVYFIYKYVHMYYNIYFRLWTLNFMTRHVNWFTELAFVWQRLSKATFLLTLFLTYIYIYIVRSYIYYTSGNRFFFDLLCDVLAFPSSENIYGRKCDRVDGFTEGEKEYIYVYIFTYIFSNIWCYFGTSNMFYGGFADARLGFFARCLFYRKFLIF